MNLDPSVMPQFIKANRHLDALTIQDMFLRQHKIIIPIDLVKEQLAAVRAEAHASGSVTPR
jgi:hypothetical protein